MWHLSSVGQRHDAFVSTADDDNVCSTVTRCDSLRQGFTSLCSCLDITLACLQSVVCLSILFDAKGPW